MWNEVVDETSRRSRSKASRLQECSQNWRYDGFIERNKRVFEWLRAEFADHSWKEIRRLLHQSIEDGGEIDEQVERRPEYAHYEFHYDLRMPIGGRRIYFETVLMCEDANDPDGSSIIVVNVHDV